MFLKRSYSPEILDDFSIRDGRIDLALKELNVINSLLGGNSITMEGIKLLRSEETNLTILDVGAGASDILLRIKRKFDNLNIHCLDKNQRACKYLKTHSEDVKVICGDVLNLPFGRSYDIIHASLFLHHFNEEEIKKIIVSLLKLCSKGIIINDLRRSIFAWAGIKILSTLFSSSREVKYDGPLSVRRGFIKSDWTFILNSISMDHYTITRKWAFRWLIVIYK
jgi:2-polyprenyl-3-methyl-5-hydroxy-6-metoxy-1,4-benzoquinol methylase